MNKKGFTLIELLGVVTLIVLISLIVTPNIISNFNKKKGEISEANMKLLGAATGVYIENHPTLFTNSFEANGSTYCIPIQSLINDGVINTPFKDVNGNEVDYSYVVKATYNYSYNDFDYQFVSKDQCTQVIQYVSRPELSDNMIPVIYENGSWKKADPNSKWYNYLDKNWANAVVVKEYVEGSNSMDRYDYLNAPVGTVINDSDILGFFVWIPRFRYQLFSSNSPVSINIAFEGINSVKSTGNQTGQWLTHPAFTYNGTELSGIWVGKYESGNSNDNIIIRSDTPWTNIDYVSANTKALSMTDINNIYGLNGVNTHMVKNSEWSAVAYLTNSIFGSLSNNSSTGNNTGIYNLSGNKELVILDNENQYSIGYALSETNGWSNDNSYVTSDNLYLTRGGNSIFNYQNSKVIDSNTTFRVSLINNSSSQDYKRKYVVTFDPNGGTVSQTSKEVSYHDAYGELPVPTRSGYTFKGWNGKNKFNEQKYLYINQYTIRENSYTWAKIDLEENNTYKVSIVRINNFDGKAGYLILSPKKSPRDDGEYTVVAHASNPNYSKTNFIYNINSGQSLYIGYYSTSQNVMDTIWNNTDLQIEEGNVVTEYEPYYVTSHTLVTQDKNHTLKAIWEAN